MALVNGLEIVPDHSVLCIEEHAGNIKSIYAIYVASEWARTDPRTLSYASGQGRCHEKNGTAEDTGI